MPTPKLNGNRVLPPRGGDLISGPLADEVEEAAAANWNLHLTNTRTLATKKRLNDQVKRNAERSPADFMFQLTASAWRNLKSQFATSSLQDPKGAANEPKSSQFVTRSHGGRRKLPSAFTEHGALMAANVLNSPDAVRMSVYVVRAFIKQRELLLAQADVLKRDGFHALVNYHKLAAGERGRKVLESLTHSYLGDWIVRQKDGEKRGEAGAEERLGAALELKKRLEAIIEGEGDPAQGTGFDIFVRWKPLSEQAIGWEPDINDGVRMNIRPFLASDLPNGKKGAGVLRWKPNIKWEKDRGKEPQRDRSDFPWFWNGSGFTGDRVNDVHLTNEQKRKARCE